MAILVSNFVHTKNTSKRTRSVSLIFSFTMVIFVLITVLSFANVNLSRFDYIDVLKSGGTNRVQLWQALVPVIIEKYWRFGIGPGEHCTSLLIYKLTGLRYTHSHNLLLEAFCELGIMGFIIFALLLLYTFVKGLKNIKENTYAIIPFICFISIVVNGIGESYICNIALWLIIAWVIASNRTVKK